MSRQLRVLHVIDSMGHGGAEQNLLTMLGQLVEGYEHHVLTLYEDDRLRGQFERVTSSRRCLGLRRTVDLAAAVPRVAEHIRTLGIQLVSAQLLRAQLVGRLAAAIARVPVVVTWQNMSYSEDSLSEFANSQLKRMGSLTLDRVTSFRDAATIAVSAAVRDDNCRRLGVPPQRVHVIPNAVGLDRIVPLSDEQRSRLRSELGFTAEHRMVLSVGRLVAQKAHSDAIRAMRKVRLELPSARYVIAGQGPLRDELQALIDAENVADVVRLLGPRSDVPALLQAADCFLFPSLFEGLPVALIEAIGSGTRCVASSIAPNLEAAAGCSGVTFVPTRSPDAIAASVLATLRQPAGTSSDADVVRARFAPATVARALGSVFREVSGTA